jgi:predicted membrane protein DUF2207
MAAAAIEGGIVVAALGAFRGCYLTLRVVTRPATVDAVPATLDLGDEPPAVVNLLVNGWVVTDDAATATVLDLARRGYLELRQPAGDPRQTTVHLARRPDGALRPFEDRVLRHLSDAAVHGVAPVAALSFSDERTAASWHRALRVEVVAEARRIGLSRRRFSPATTAALSAGALAAATAVLAAFVHAGLYQLQPPSVTAGLCCGAVAWLLVAGALGRLAVGYPGERDTAEGAAAAARWRGVQQWLRAQESFADSPPAAIAVWDRYLPYGAALGVTRLASRILELGVGDRRRRWSCHGGTWHRVRVRYPRLWPHLGKRAAELAKPAVQAVVVGLVLVLFNDAPRIWLPRILGAQADAPAVYDVLEPLAVIAGAVLIPLGALRLLQVLLDVTTSRTITGTVLWTEPWPETVLGRAYHDRAYLALDDGTTSTVTAWALPRHLGCATNDLVRVKARRWTRRVITLELLERRTRPTATAALDFNGLGP